MRWWLVLVLVVATATARAESTQPMAATNQAQAKVADLDGALARDLTEQRDLQAKFSGETANIDRMKQRRRSWANDKELNTAQAEATETAQQLETVGREIKATQDKLASARKELVAAI